MILGSLNPHLTGTGINTMKPEKIEKKIIEIVEEQLLGIYPEEITTKSTFDELNCDSLDLIEFVMTVEEEFDIEISENIEKDFVTIQSVVDYISENQ